ncbi:MAG: acetyl-CoA carboxylase biotin carboxylase subunit [Clostridia bacterium]|nr:acetyl-CoA carboxylase biotin carboxylase subunit [Clostridia bacterium]
MFKRVLIANRGEIAIRIIRACQELGIETVAVYSEADREALHTRMADKAVCIGPAAAHASYLHIPSLLAAARMSGADAIHPGYGFLAENAYFAEMCALNGITFIGPAPEAMRLLGAKATARETMLAAGVPVVPGSPGVVKDLDAALAIAREIGYPVLIKATAGGGGRGMRVAESHRDLRQAFLAAQREAAAAFGDSLVYLEKYIEAPRHIEFQIFGDGYGNIIHLGERDCSLQRRNQKILEEAPSVALTPRLRAEMGQVALKVARHANYYSAGTVEFLLDSDGHYYFMEMNTRIQVEHPVTEAVTGIDLVQEQIKVAAGEPLSFSQEDVQLRGHAIECRINAEDPANNFQPAPGRIEHYHAPGGFGVRVESAVYSGYVIPAEYDSLLAKVIIWAPSRAEAINRMARALAEMKIEGVPTTIPFHRQIMGNAYYQRGEIYTNFIQQRLLAG